jgi:mono/diheme cytochrome c family protein
MRNFILGVVITLVVLIAAAAGFLLLGFMPTNADATPGHMEMRVAMTALDASMDHHAARVNTPIPPTDDNLIDGMKIYTMNCSGCHGTLDKKPSPLENSFYPPPPQVINDPLDDPEWHLYYAIRTGVRYTGMPAWNKALSDDQIWKVTLFLSHLEKLPPAVQDYWKKAYGAPAEAEPAETKGMEGMKGMEKPEKESPRKNNDKDKDKNKESPKK